ncbi:MAG: hypothetical protein ACK4FJ_15745 [Ferrovibrio sp.]|uniref:hypothetical protein n=1 Tax=Ferrovibrio sp. TaxID=1917215 RepID=UPI00391CDBC0
MACAISGVTGLLIGGASIYFLGISSTKEGIIPVAAVAGLIGTLIGALLSYFLKRYELRVAEITARVDDIITEVKAIEEAAAEYWARTAKEGDKLVEERLTGRLHRLSQLVAYCQNEGWESDILLENKLIRFRAAVSGAPFGESDRFASYHKVRNITGTGSDLIITVRKARRRIL